METAIYNQKGESAGKVSLPKNVFGVSWNSDLVHQVVVSMQSSMRKGTSHTKTRGEVRGGGKKPWRQKGTGQARHGSTRSPIWKGGGVTHGPRADKNYQKKVNKKMKAKAVRAILSKRMKDGEIVFVDNLSVLEPKTKNAVEILSKLNKVPALKGVIAKQNAFLIYTPEMKDDVYRSFKNIQGVSLEELRNINPITLLSKKRIIFISPEQTLRFLSPELAEVKSEVNDLPEKMPKNRRKLNTRKTPKIPTKALKTKGSVKKS